MSLKAGTLEWSPDGSHPIPPDDLGFGAILKSHGEPDDANGSNGDLDVDLDSGNVYQRTSGIWTLVTGAAGGGVGEVHFIATPGQDPNSHVSATRGAIAYDGNGAVWVKTNSGTNNTGWVQVLN